MPFVKLDTGILDSSLWLSDPHVRIVFLTMLAMARSDGLVEATAPGISRRANLSLETVREALANLESPDPDSRSLEDGGRRIRRVDGGYYLTNYIAYREKSEPRDPEHRRAYMREYMRQYRKGEVNNVNNSKQELDAVSREGEGEGEAEEDSRRDAGASEPARDYVWRVGVDLLTSAGESDRGSRSFLGKLCKDYGNEAVREAVGRALAVAPAEPKAWLKAALKNKTGDEPYYGDT